MSATCKQLRIENATHLKQSLDSANDIRQEFLEKESSWISWQMYRDKFTTWKTLLWDIMEDGE